MRTLKSLADDETLLIQSGKPVGVLRTHEAAPRVLLANSNLVGRWSNWEHFNELERKGLMMYGQMTAGSWIYIGSQGIVQGTYETFAEAGRQHFGGSLDGKLVVSGGMGGMGGAQPLAATMNGARFLGVDVDADRVQKRLKSGYCDHIAWSARRSARNPRRQRVATTKAISVGSGRQRRRRAAGVHRAQHRPRCAHRPDQRPRSAAWICAQRHEPRSSTDTAREQPEEYTRRSMETMGRHVEAMLELKRVGAVTFDYGNNLRTQAKLAGVEDAFDIPGFVPEYIRPLFCEGKGPFRWVALSGDPKDIYRTDKLILELFPEDASLRRWIELAQKRIHFQGLPARICWLGYGQRAKFGVAMNELVRNGEIIRAHRHWT